MLLERDAFSMEDARAPVRAVGFNADGSEIWFGGGTGNRLLLTPMLGGQVRSFLGDEVVTVSWSPDGLTLATAGREGRVLLWDSSSGDLLAALGRRPAKDASVLSWSREGDRLVSGIPGRGEVRLWSTENLRTPPRELRRLAEERTRLRLDGLSVVDR